MTDWDRAKAIKDINKRRNKIGGTKQNIKEIQNFLKNINSAYSLGKKENYLARLKIFQDVLDFPWREDQKEVLEQVIKDEYQYYVINGIFGCGKTTLLLGILINSFIKRKHIPTECMFISFNISIKNEIKRKLNFLLEKLPCVRMH